MHIAELLEIIKGRRSVRLFTPDDISDEEVRLLLEAARYAPSNSNRQPWRFLVIRSRHVREEMASAVNKKAAEIRSSLADAELIKMFDDYTRYLSFFQDAPVVIVALTKRPPSFLEGLSRKLNLKLTDPAISPELMSVSMAIQNIHLAAHAMGFGSCCMTSPLLAGEEIQKILDVRPPYQLVAIIPVGKYSQEPRAPERKDIAAISEFME